MTQLYLSDRVTSEREARRQL